MKEAIGLKLEYLYNENPVVLTGYADADWVGDINDRKSVSCNVVNVFGSVAK